MDSSLSGQAFPVRHKNLSVDIKGHKTDIVICSYDDHFLVIATQIGSMGTILHARKEEGVSIHPTFNVSVVFGKRDEPMLVACARQLIEHMSNSGSSRPLVLALGLRDHSVGTLKGIVSAVIENCLWDIETEMKRIQKFSLQLTIRSFPSPRMAYVPRTFISWDYNYASTNRT